MEKGLDENTEVDTGEEGENERLFFTSTRRNTPSLEESLQAVWSIVRR